METSAADRVEPAASICKHILTFFARRLPPGRLPRSLFSYNERALVRRRGGNLAARGSAPGPRAVAFLAGAGQSPPSKRRPGCEQTILHFRAWLWPGTWVALSLKSRRKVTHAACGRQPLRRERIAPTGKSQPKPWQKPAKTVAKTCQNRDKNLPEP